MNGSIALRSVLINDAALIALIPASNMVADDAFPQDFDPPGILLRVTSGVTGNIVKRGAMRHVKERITAEVHVNDNPLRQNILKALRNAGDQRFPQLSGLENVVITLAGRGPDGISIDTYVRMGSQDFMVSYSEPVT